MVRRRRQLAGLAMVLAVLAIAALLFRQPKKQVVVPEPARDLPAPAPSPAPMVEITLTGPVQVANVVKVTPPVEGTIEQWMAGLGDVVIEARVLARVKNPKLASTEAMAEMEMERGSNRVAQLESAVIAARLEVSRSEADAARTKLEFERADKEYQRQRLMYREGITARVVYEKSQQDYNTLEADSARLAETIKNAVNRVGDITVELASARRDRDQQRASLEEARAESSAGEVRSPVAGIIVARCCQVGDSVTPSTSLFEITSDLTALQVTAPADSAMLQRVRAGQPAIVEVENIPGAMAGKVREAGFGQVIVDFTSASSAVRPGMLAQVRIKVS